MFTASCHTSITTTEGHIVDIIQHDSIGTILIDGTQWLKYDTANMRSALATYFLPQLKETMVVVDTTTGRFEIDDVGIAFILDADRISGTLMISADGKTLSLKWEYFNLVDASLVTDNNEGN